MQAARQVKKADSGRSSTILVRSGTTFEEVFNMRFTRRNLNKGSNKTEAVKPPAARASPRKKPKAEEEAEEKAPKVKPEKIQDTKNNRQPTRKGKGSRNIPKGNKKGKETEVPPQDDKKTDIVLKEEKQTDNSPKDHSKADEIEGKVKEENQDSKSQDEIVKGRGRSAAKGKDNSKAKVPAKSTSKSPAKSTAGKRTPLVPKVKKAMPVKPKAAPPPPAAEPDKKTPAPTRTSARGRIPKIIVDPSEEKETTKNGADSNKTKSGNKKAAQKRKSTSKANAQDGDSSKAKAAKKTASRKSSVKGEKPVLITASVKPPTITAPIASGEKNLVQVTHIIEEQVVSPQILDPGATTSNGIPTLPPTDLLLSESSPQRFTKMIMQPSQELPAEIFQNEQTVTVTSPQKSPKILKLVLGPQGSGTSLLQGINPVRGPAVIVRQNSAAGDVGNPDQITCLNVFNGSPRRSATGTDSNGENGPSTSDARGAGDSEDNGAARYYNPSSPGKLVGEGLHNYCKSPLLAPAGTFPPSPTITKISTQDQLPVKQSSVHSEIPEKKSRKRSVSSGVVDAPEKSPRRVIASPPAPVGPSPTRRSSRGNAGIPPKRDSMIEIPIVNRRRSSSTNLS